MGAVQIESNTAPYSLGVYTELSWSKQDAEELNEFLESGRKAIYRLAGARYIEVLKSGLPAKAAKELKATVDENGLIGEVPFGLNHENLSNAMKEFNKVVDDGMEKLIKDWTERFKL